MTRPPAASEIAVRAAEQGLDPAHQLAQPERLGQVVIRTQLEPDDLVHLLVARGQEQHGRLVACSANAAEHLEPVHARQANVEDDQVRRVAGCHLEALLTIARNGDLVALLFQRVLDPARDGVLVFDNQDRGGHG